MLKTFLQLVPHIVVLLQELNVLSDQVIEVHRVVLFQTALIEAINFCDSRAEEVGAFLLVLRRPHQHVLGVGDPGQDSPRRKGVVVHLQLTHAASDQRQLIGGVVDGEGLAESEAVGIAAE